MFTYSWNIIRNNSELSILVLHKISSFAGLLSSWQENPFLAQKSTQDMNGRYPRDWALFAEVIFNPILLVHYSDSPKTQSYSKLQSVLNKIFYNILKICCFFKMYTNSILVIISRTLERTFIYYKIYHLQGNGIKQITKGHTCYVIIEYLNHTKGKLLHCTYKHPVLLFHPSLLSSPNQIPLLHFLCLKDCMSWPHISAGSQWFFVKIKYLKEEPGMLTKWH